MARITLEDCLKKIPNRFELVMAASKRARQLEVGADNPHVPWENDKPTVVALREIANGNVDLHVLREQESDRGTTSTMTYNINVDREMDIRD